MSERRVARPGILQRVPHDRSTVIEASAGTGKTFTLEHLIVDLLLSTDVTLDRILVVTFTEKATNELRTRVRATLDRLASGEGDEPGAGERGSGVWTIDAAARDKLTAARNGFDAATITTIHAFCQRVLRENAFFSGRLFEEQQVDGRDAFGRAFREALRRDVAPHPERASWLEAALRAGSTIAQIEDLLWACTTARGDLRPRFDEAALRRALDAFPVDEARRQSGGDAFKTKGVPASTATAIGKRMGRMAEAVDEWREGRSLPRYVAAADGIGFEQLEKLRSSSPPAAVSRLSAAALALADATPTFPAALAQLILGPVREELERRKRDAGQYDFDDMLARVDEALQGPGGAALVGALRRRWRYALIDEFQDTDEIQWGIFRRAFFQPADRPSTVYLVGDPKQSIYRFRGADVETYLQARSEVESAGGSRVALDRSYRATPALVDALNAIFDEDVEEPVFQGAITYQTVECGRPDLTLVDGDGRVPAPVHLFRTEGIPSADSLGPLIAREIVAITTPGRRWTLDRREIAHSDIFVLTRTRNEGRTVGDHLREAGVPYAFFKEDGLFQTDEARDVRALLRAIEDPTDRARRFAAWLTPFFGLSLAALEDARDLLPSHPYVARLAAWKTLADARDYGRLFEAVVRESGLVRREIFFEDSERELTNYLHIFELLLEHARRTRGTLRELLLEMHGLIEKTRRPLDLEGDVQRIESEKRAVQIMTIHKAKGLEAAVVFVAGGVSRSRFDAQVRVYHEGGRRLAWVGPTGSQAKTLIKEEEREEDARLMYVALTRAKARLYLPCAMKGEEALNLSGSYRVVNERLAALVRSGAPWLDVQDVALTPAAPVASAAPVADLPVPALELLRDRGGGLDYEAVREAHAGTFVTSYTRMRGGPRGALRGWIDQPDARRAQKAAEDVDASGPIALRGSRASGVFLHELLERVPLASFKAAATFDAWRARSEIVRLLDETIAVHRVDRTGREHAARMVWTAYTTSVALPDGVRIDGLAGVDRVAREMDFVYPIPASEQGLVRGSLDLAFDVGDRTYFVDWKSDSLPSYASETLERHVRAHYDDQVRLYSIAVTKLLGIASPAAHAARFGGILYCFLRGLDATGRGVWSARPSWEDLVGWQRELGERRAWGADGVASQARRRGS